MGNIVKFLWLGKTIYRHTKTGLCKILTTDDPLVLSGEYVGVNVGKRLNKSGNKNMVLARHISGEVKFITAEEFKNSTEYVGINKGKEGMWGDYNQKYAAMSWYDKMMFTNPSKTKAKRSSDVLFLNIFDLNRYVRTYLTTFPNRKKLSLADLKTHMPHLFYKTVDKPLEFVLSKLRNGWNPELDEEFIESWNIFNTIITRNDDENYQVA